MHPIFVFGANGHAGVVIDIIEKQDVFEIVGLIDTYVPRNTRAHGYRVLGTEQDLPELMSEYGALGGIVAIGDNSTRAKVVARIREQVPEFAFVTAIHPAATLGRGTCIGAGTAIMAGAIVNPGTKTGEHCIVNTKASLDHDNVMGNFSSLGPGAITGGNVRIGQFAVLAQGACVIHGRQIGEHAVVGAGSTVLRDIPPFTVSYGTPARVIRARQAGEKYL